MAELTRFRGDTYPFTVKVRLNGRAFNLTGCTLKMTVSAHENPTTETPEFTMTGVVASPATAGIASFTPLSTDVDLLGTYYYDIEVTDSGNLVHTADKGTIVFSQDITK